MHYILTSESEIVGDDGVWSTIEDLYLWDQNLYANRLGQGRQALVERYLQPGRLADGSSTPYACGLCISSTDGRTLFEHNGWITGYLSVYERFPDKQMSIFILSNTNRMIPWEYTTKVRQVLFRTAMEWDRVAVVSRVEDVSRAQEVGSTENANNRQDEFLFQTSGSEPTSNISNKDWESLPVVGSYQCLDNAYIWRVYNAEGQLKISVNESWEMELVPRADREFEVGAFQVRFVEGNDAKPHHLQVTREKREWTFFSFPQASSTGQPLSEFTGTYHCHELRTTYEVERQADTLCLKNHNRHRRGLDLAFRQTLGDLFYAHDPFADLIVIEFMRDLEHKIECFVFRSLNGDGREQLRFEKAPSRASTPQRGF